MAENAFLSDTHTVLFFLILSGENSEPEAEYRLHGGLAENSEAER